MGDGGECKKEIDTGSQEPAVTPSDLHTTVPSRGAHAWGPMPEMALALSLTGSETVDDKLAH